MTTPTPQKTLSPHLPANWQGGTFEGHLGPLTEDWYAEERTELERVDEMGDWSALEPLTAGDPPESWGAIDLGSAGAPAGPRQTEARSGAVLRVSATGVVLDDHPDVWLNLSRYASPPVDLRGVHTGDVCTAQVEVGRDGRCYLVSIRVIPLDGFDPPETGEAPPGGER